MQIEFQCHHCQATIEADSQVSGLKAECPNCGEILLIPAPGVKEGLQIAQYRMERKLGTGGMGEVWLATHLTLDRKVAIKILPPALTQDERQIQRFLHEVRMTGKLEHPNIVTAFDAGFADGFYYLAMSYIDGEDLESRLKREKRFPENEVLRIALNIALALDYAWNRYRMLHRDIKPANIMLTRDNQVKLMDMGIAKSLEEDSQLTMQGMLVGTPYYISPEQATSNPGLDCRADIYSLGATMFHLVTGKRPYEGATAMAVIAQHLSASVPDPRILNTELTEPTSRVIIRMMQKKPDNRFSNWKEVASCLQEILSESPTIVDSQDHGHQRSVQELSSPSLTQFKLRPRVAPPTPPPSSSPVTLPTLAIPLEKQKIAHQKSSYSPVHPQKLGIWTAVVSSLFIITLLVVVVIIVINHIHTTWINVELKRKEKELQEKGMIRETELGLSQYAHHKDIQKDLETMVNLASEYALKNPQDYYGIQERFEKIRQHAQKHNQPKYEMLAENRLKELDQQFELKGNSKEEIWALLLAKEKDLVSHHRYLIAACLYETYTGPFRDELITQCQTKSRMLRNKFLTVIPIIQLMREIYYQLKAKNWNQVESLLNKGRQELAPVLKDRRSNEWLSLWQTFEKECKEILIDRDFPSSPLVEKLPSGSSGEQIPHILWQGFKLWSQGNHETALKMLIPLSTYLPAQILVGILHEKDFLGTWTVTEIPSEKNSYEVPSWIQFDMNSGTIVIHNQNLPVSWFVLGSDLYWGTKEGKWHGWEIQPVGKDEYRVIIQPKVSARLKRSN